jgi:hypothetical protein
MLKQRDVGLGPFCDAAAASAGRAPAASAWRLLCPLTKLRLATTAAITSCHRVFVFPELTTAGNP